MFAEGSRHSEELAAIGDKAKQAAAKHRHPWQSRDLGSHGRRHSRAGRNFECRLPSGATYHQIRTAGAIHGDMAVPVTALDGHRALAMGLPHKWRRQKNVVDMTEVGL